MKLSPRAILLAAFLICAGAAALLHSQQQDPLAGLLIAEAQTGDIEQAVQATGSLRPVQLVAVGAQVSGRITSMRVSIGQSVKQGELIAEIDSLPQQNDLRTAEAALADVRAQKRQKEATLAYAAAVFEREQMTLARLATSRDSWESAKATVEATRAQIDSLNAQIAEAEVKVDTARVNLGYTRITAPIDGTVLLVMAQQGQTVNAVQSAPTIAVIGEIGRMEVRTEISEADAPRVKVGQNVVFSILGDLGRQWEAVLEALDPAPDSLRSDSAIPSSTASATSTSSSSTTSAIYYYGRFTVPNLDGLLRTYMTAQVRVILGEAKGAVTVPMSALSPPGPGGERTVEVVGQTGAIERRRVIVGLNDKIRCEIKSGLQPGERVIIGRAPTEPKSQVLPPPPGGL
ncbi:MAG: efflux RND transporter periplasmic adaptor subunit [Rhodomicrobium sp.]